MISTINRKLQVAARHRRIRSRLSGTAERPRVAVSRSAKHIRLQAIDDTLGKTLAAASDLKLKTPVKTARAAATGQALAEALKNAGVKAVVFDRGGFAYHGRVKAAAEALREAGITV